MKDRALAWFLRRTPFVVKSNKQRISSLALVAVISLTMQVYGSNIYVSQNGAGSQNGSSPSNAYALSWLNTSGNWGNGTGKVGPGTTVVLEGTITSAITIQGSGTAGNPITILFDTNCVMTAPYWPFGSGDGSGAITIFQKQYIVINGQNVGAITATQCGTAWTNAGSIGVDILGSSYITVENLSISNMYSRTSSKDEGNVGSSCINVSAVAGSWNNVLIMNCALHDSYIGVASDYGNCSTLDIASNTIYCCNWGGCCADRGSGATMTNLCVHDNWFYSWTNWNDTVADDFHHNGFYQWANSGGSCNGVFWYRNRLGPGWGGQYQTSGLWDDGNTKNTYMFDNVVYANSGEYAANEFLQGGWYVFNNTILGGGAGHGIGSGGSGITAVIMGNIVTACQPFYNPGTIGTLEIDTNIYYNVVYPFVASSSYSSFASWQGAGYDTHGEVANPLLNSDSSISSSNSPAIGFGPNLTSFCQSVGLPATDINGNPRPSSGAWAAGAYEYGAGVVHEPVISTVQSSPTTNAATITWTTDENANSIVNYGLTASYGMSVTNSSSVTNHSITLSNLTGGTVYHFQVCSIDATNRVNSSGDFTFITGATNPPTVSAISANVPDVDTNTPGLQIYEGTTVQFSATASAPNGDALTWQWLYSLNGGTQTLYQSGSGTAPAASFTYTNSTAGNTNVWTLQVTDSQTQLSAQTNLTISVELPPPQGFRIMSN
jgi:hypothetical protein